jgi:hypothetical protein
MPPWLATERDGKLIGPSALPSLRKHRSGLNLAVHLDAHADRVFTLDAKGHPTKLRIIHTVLSGSIPMPDLDWAWGYPFGLSLILASALIPLFWFKWRGWF